MYNAPHDPTARKPYLKKAAPIYPTVREAMEAAAEMQPLLGSACA